MKTKIGIVILVVVCAGLLIALIATKKQADDQHKKDADAILEFSNQLITANINLDDLRQVNLMLTNDLAATRQALIDAFQQSHGNLRPRSRTPRPRCKTPRTRSPT